MAERIKYETDRSGMVMKTPCPKGKEIGGEPIYVGSNCCYVCPYFVNENRKRHYVECNYDACEKPVLKRV